LTSRTSPFSSRASSRGNRWFHNVSERKDEERERGRRPGGARPYLLYGSLYLLLLIAVAVPIFSVRLPPLYDYRIISPGFISSGTSRHPNCSSDTTRRPGHFCPTLAARFSWSRSAI
jgi:hypothetical protein